MDELSLVFDDNENESNRRKTRKSGRISERGIKRKTQSSNGSPNGSSDDGIGLSFNSLNDSIASRIKRRSNEMKDNSKQFDSKYFYNRVVDQITHKYKNVGTDDAIIDVENLEVVDKKGVIQKRIRTEFGYFADNTLENLRQTSFRDKSLIKSPILEAAQEVSHSTPKNMKNSTKRPAKKFVSNKNPVKQNIPKSAPTFKRNLSRSLSRNSQQARPQSMPKNIIQNELVLYENDEQNCEELDESHPLVRYENRSLWIDRDFQLECLRNVIELLKKDQSGRFRAALKQQAMQTLNLPVLPSGPNLIPRIIFNAKGEPNFEFYFQSSKSPLDVTEELHHMNHQILQFSLIIYDLIRIDYNINANKNQRQLNYRNKRQIQYN